MSKNWAIAIGINRYDYLQPLNYAKRDAQLIQQFLRSEAGFEKIFFFTDDSPEIGGKSTRPTRANLRRVFLELFNQPFMGAGDNFWFFFSGHGMRHAERDYLMPSDGHPGDIAETAIPINFVTERLRRCGADNVVLILDACRSLGTRAGEGIGRQTAEEASQQGVISIFSCSPQEYSYEIEAFQQGAFTTALLEGLGVRGQCATVERLNQYLNFRVPEIVRQHNNGRQTPYIIAEPVNKSHLILVPRYATLADIATLKNDAYRAKDEGNLDLSEQLWIRVLAAASGTDIEAVRALQRIERLRWEGQVISPPPSRNTPDNSTKGTSTVEKNPLKTFQFETVTVDAQGNITNRRNCEAKYWVEDLGNGVTLEMVQIPGGTFMMGLPEGEAYLSEKPQHQVTVPEFFMGKYQVTQAQYQAVMGGNIFQKIIGNNNNNPANFKGEKRPVETVSWNDAVEFCQKLSQKTGKTYRLPSEAEWEYACRAGTTTPFYFGETITTDLANYRGTDWNYEGTLYPGNYDKGPKGQYREQTTDVGKFPPNSFGLYDMHGNVWEWCQDHWHDNYNGAPTNGSAWLNDNDNQSRRLLRGGSWGYLPVNCRIAYRLRYAADFRNYDVGFRVVLAFA
ncbi:SUMF1/EgtB/PvdO family nonheme iron enzyme [Halotia branconii]|uniref:SUMF1/EgtB/PvdO family nonheme iron enzyme n=1 Tax=Halotia branconii CENA392 TaxID=1539056 RepID=A0AAJ6NR31_9CYAN|nr:SUMF1/EgtB/PvdO family nonheme iron enzyme [Halotia branconii]WGV25150.1 SUMF1/EgtB/PvdO family nonheme iron enzyme [Halotia branconii CENA392]